MEPHGDVSAARAARINELETQRTAMVAECRALQAKLSAKRREQA